MKVNGKELLVLGCLVSGIYLVIKSLSDSLEMWKKTAEYNRRSSWLTNIWFKRILEGKKIADYVRKNGYEKIAIYGMGEIGKLLYKDLGNNGVNVLYGIDRNAAYISCDIPLYTVDEELPDTDLIIVTPFNYIENIKDQLEKKVQAEICAIDEILYEMG